MPTGRGLHSSSVIRYVPPGAVVSGARTWARYTPDASVMNEAVSGSPIPVASVSTMRVPSGPKTVTPR